MMAPLSLLVLYLWSTTPSVASPHELHTAGGATLTRPVVFLTAWMLMTAAMMLPSAMPLLVSLDRIAREPVEPARHSCCRGARLSGGLGAGRNSGVDHERGGARPMSCLAQVPQVVSGLAGGGLVLAGVYGLSPLASACLRACRRPFGFLARYWRGGIQCASAGGPDWRGLRRLLRRMLRPDARHHVRGGNGEYRRL